MTTSTDPAEHIQDRPSTFLRLPLELQKTIFEKYCQKPWEVTTVEPRHNDPNNVARYRLDGCFWGPLLVSKFFHKEFKLAVAKSRSGTLNNNLFDIPTDAQWFDSGVTEVNTDSEFRRESCIGDAYRPSRHRHSNKETGIRLTELQDRFKNLESFTLTDPLNGSADWVNALCYPDLYDVLVGNMDQELVECTRAEVGRHVDLEMGHERRTPKVSWFIWLDTDQMSLDDSLVDLLDDQSLCLEFVLDSEGCQIVNRYFIMNGESDERKAMKVADAIELLQPSANEEIGGAS